MRSVQILSAALTALMLFVAAPALSLEWGKLEGNIKDTIESLHLGKHSIETHYRSGKLTVTGYVTSEKERTKVISELTKLHGISSVEDKLTVEPNGSSGSDTSVTLRRAVLDGIRGLKGLGVYSIEVRPGPQGIMLMGTAANEADKNRIEGAAKQVLGDTRFESKITVAPQPSKSELANRVLAALKKEDAIDLTGVSVRAEGSTVTISGAKSNHEEIDQILSVANMVDGVKEVKSEMTLNR